MTASTSGVEVRAPSRFVRDAVELLSSMRFSISLLTVICIASVIGTVVKQHEPALNYVNQFGPFWALVFGSVNLYTVYSAGWFLLILAFLVLSTSLCIARNTPKIMADLRNYKEGLREQSLQAFHLKGQAVLAESRDKAFERVTGVLGGSGWRAKAQQRGNGTMIAARKGAANKLGYIAAHSSIVLICIGGLLDGDLIVKAQMWWQDKSVYAGVGLVRDVPARHRLGTATPTFRANLLVPEGARTGTAIINVQDGVVLQDLPFEVELQKFIVEYYDTGMPRLFASDIVIHDRETGERIPARVEVNKPAQHRGVMIYQSSFDDGGSPLTLRAVPMATGATPFDVKGTVGGSSTFTTASGEKLTLEMSGLRVINVENFAEPAGNAEGATDVRKVDLRSPLKRLDEHLGSGIKVRNHKELRNIGPSVSYKLRDAAGQAREFNNYMLPVDLEGHPVFLAGVRDNPSEPFRYLRIPADEKGSMAGFARLREALADPVLREKAAQRYVVQAAPADRPEMREQLLLTTRRVLGLYSGAESAAPEAPALGGLQGLSAFLETNVPADDRPRISEVLLRILNGSLFELLNLTREDSGQKPMVNDDEAHAFMTQAVMSLSDSFFYPAPVLFQLTDFTHVQASVFQVARAPGKTLVYTGAILLIIGVFAMLYIRERRLWVWIADADPAAPGSGTKIATALSTTRRTLDADAEFDALKAAILKEAR